MTLPKTYRGLKAKIKRLCRKEKLKLIEAELNNDGIIIWISNGCILINSKYKGKDIPYLASRYNKSTTKAQQKTAKF